jgi:hypothetical protein
MLNKIKICSQNHSEVSYSTLMQQQITIEELLELRIH